MQTSNILSASLIDIVFDGRNKDYGAYELRQHYAQRIGKALMITGIIVFIAFGGAVLAASMKKRSKKLVTYVAYDPTVLKAETKPKLPDPPKPKEIITQAQTQKFVTFKMVDKPIVEPPPSIDKLDSSVIGIKTVPGIVDPYGPPAVDSMKRTGIIDIQPKGNDDNDIHETVDVDARYPGDWKRFLEKNLDPEVPARHEAPAGRYSVVIRFVVDTEGNVSDITALTDHGYGMEDEAIRVIRKATKWEPAFQNGFHVKAYRKQVIVFELNQD